MRQDTFDVAETLLRRLRGAWRGHRCRNTVFAAVTGVSIASAAAFTLVAVLKWCARSQHRFAAGRGGAARCWA